jgi:hypothetical protein
MQDSTIQVLATNYDIKPYQIDNFIGTFPEFFSDEYCDFLVKIFEQLLNSGFGKSNIYDVQRKDTVAFSHEV